MLIKFTFFILLSGVGYSMCGGIFSCSALQSQNLERDLTLSRSAYTHAQTLF